MDRPPFFAFYPADFANDLNVEAMTTLQVGAYVLLLCKAWQADPPASLPNDDHVLARLARVDVGVWAEIKPGVLGAFRLGSDGRWHNKRLRLEYDKALQLIKSRKRAGEKGAERRWGKGDGKPNGSAMAEPLGSQCDSNAIQSQILKPPNPPPGGGEGKKAAKKPQAAEAVPIPPELDAPDFRATWADWLADRKARKKTVTELAARQQLEKLKPFGVATAIECIRRSISNGWTALVTDGLKPSPPAAVSAPPPPLVPADHEWDMTPRARQILDRKAREREEAQRREHQEANHAADQ